MLCVQDLGIIEYKDPIFTYTARIKENKDDFAINTYPAV